MRYGELQYGALALSHTQFVNLPLHSVGIQQAGGTLGGHGDRRDPEPICPSCVPSVASSIISINGLAPFFRFARAQPAMLPERSKISTISVGLDTISVKTAILEKNRRNQYGYY